jgi:hypothetical protein
MKQSRIVCLVLAMVVVCQSLASEAKAQSQFSIQIDATKLFYYDLLLLPGDATKTFSTAKVRTFQLAADSYRFQFGSAMIADFVFKVAADGKIQYDTDCDGFLSGRGTSTLTISGLEVTLDARHLTGSDPALHTGVLLANAQLIQILATDWISLGTVRLLPAKGYGV